MRIHYLLIGICSLAWAVTAIGPHDLEAWALEQIAAIICIALFLWSARHTTYSSVALSGLTILFVCHAIGTHYTYSLTPYDPFFQSLTGTSLNDIMGWERNHYDRFVHFLFGLTTSRVFYEFLLQNLGTTQWVAWTLSLNLVISTSAFYELMEWWAVLLFAADTGILYLGTQGDVWDAQIDIALGGLGFLLMFLGYKLFAFRRLEN